MHERIKVLVVIRGFHNGGIEKVFENYYHHMDLSSFEIHFVTHMKNDPSRKKTFEDLGCVIHELSPIKGHKLNIQNYKEYKSLFSNTTFNVVHNNIPENLLPLYFARKQAVKVRIIHTHSEYMKGVNGTIKRQLYKLGYLSNIRNANVLIAISEAAAKSTFFSKYVQAKILPNAIDIEEYSFCQEKRDEMRKKFNLDGKYVIGHVGRFESKVKNHEFIIEVFNSVSKRIPEAYLVLIGEGKEKERIRRKVEELGLDNKVLFAGAVSNVPDYLMAMDLFLFPSRQEGLGIAAIEAQTAGLPCIVSNQVPKEVRITELVSFLPISGDDAIELWEKKIIEENNKYQTAMVREKTDRIIREAGYDIREQARSLEMIYQMKV